MIMDYVGAICGLIGIAILICSIIIYMVGKFNNGNKCFIIALIGTILTSIGLFLS